MEVDVWYQKLWEANRSTLVGLRDEEIEQARDLFCVDFDNRGTGFGGRVTASQEDAARWRAATQAVVAAVQSVHDRDWAARNVLFPPQRFWKRQAWRVRRERLQQEYQVQRAALVGELRAAYRAYRAAAGDLTDHVAAWRERWAREQREQEARWRAERLAAVQEGVEGAVWAYRIRDYADRQQIMIWLPALERSDDGEPAGTRGGLTARQVQDVIDDERARDPYVWIEWKDPTGEAMREWHVDLTGAKAGREAAAWATITGVTVEPIVWRPGELEKLRSSRSSGGYGPSSNYWSPSGSFGTSF